MINWIVRYAALLARHPELFDRERRVLEVGSGSEGIARALKRTVVGLDRVFWGTPNPDLSAVRGSVLELPFADAAFDDVVCVDTLEHLAASERPAAIRELVRVAAKRVIISGPAGVFAREGDAAYADLIRKSGGVLPGWLEEHLRFGIPALADLLQALLDAGRPFAVHVNEGMIQHYSGLLADNVPFVAQLEARHEQKFPTASPLRAADGDTPYSYLITIDACSAWQTPSMDGSTEPASAHFPIVAQPPGSVAMFAVGHRADRMPAIPNVRRILAGGCGPDVSFDADILRDDTGDSICERNPRYSEMTAIYWVWKNVTTLDAVGFCHYRRYFDFRSTIEPSGRATYLHDPRQVRIYQDHFADPAVVSRYLADGAVVVARPWELPCGNAELYMNSHVPEHYLVMMNYILACHPHLAPQVVAQVRDSRLTANNMFLMRWPDFDRLCRFWFDCLFAIDAELRTEPSGYQQRVVAFLSERVFDIHVRWLRDSGRRVVECPIFHLEDSAFSREA